MDSGHKINLKIAFEVLKLQKQVLFQHFLATVKYQTTRCTVLDAQPNQAEVAAREAKKRSDQLNPKPEIQLEKGREASNARKDNWGSLCSSSNTLVVSNVKKNELMNKLTAWAIAEEIKLRYLPDRGECF